MPNKRPVLKIGCHPVLKYAWVLLCGKNKEGHETVRIDGHRFGTFEEAKADFFAVRNLMNKVTHVN